MRSAKKEIKSTFERIHRNSSMVSSSQSYQTHQSSLETGTETHKKDNQNKCLAFLALFVVLAGLVGLAVYLATNVTGSDDTPVDSEGRFIYREAAVAADSPRCSELGRDILLNGGSAVDAAITGMLCVGLYNPHSAGLGGGHFLTYYDRESRQASFLNAREWAPAAAHRDMYENASSSASTFGGLAIAVPGEIKGYWAAHQRFGQLTWRELFEPIIELAENGYEVMEPLSDAIQAYENIILNDPSLSAILTDGNGTVLQLGDTIYRPQLAQTLRAVAEGGPDALYTGQMAQDIASEIQDRGGIMTAEDLTNYEVAAKTPISFDIGGLQVFSGPPPCSGVVYALIMNILEGYGFQPRDMQSLNSRIRTYHRILEADKFAYAKRSLLGDEDFVNITELVANMTSQSYADSLRARITDDQTHNYTYYEPDFQIVEDGGTSHISVVDRHGNAAAMTSTINTRLGSKVRGPKTGIIYNNLMDDFSIPGENNIYGVPPSPSNFIEPGKRPMSSMTPVIMVDSDGDVRLVAGASGGPRITLGTSLVTMETLWFGTRINEAIEKRRIYHQLVPVDPYYEEGFPQDILDGLVMKGHAPYQRTSTAVVQAIRRLDDDWLHAHSDSRKDSFPSGY